MEDLLSPKSLERRRASLQPNNFNPSPPVGDRRRASLHAFLIPPAELHRRSTCPSDQLRDAQKELFNKRVNSCPNEDEAGCLGRFQKSVGFIETVNSVSGVHNHT